MPHETLIVDRDGPVLKVTLNRPETRNALSQAMVQELGDVFAQARDDEGVSAVVLSGAGGNFCAGGDFRGMQARTASDEGGSGSGDKVTFSNRRFGALLQAINELPKAVIVLIEGAAMGGAVGLIAVADWVIAEKGAQIGTPEVTVGIVPAQITPFIVQRIGTAHARRLTAFGMRLGAEEAARIGLVHEVAEGPHALRDKGAAAISQVLRCAPGAVAETKRLLQRSLEGPTTLAPLLDEAAGMFAASLAGEAKEGIRAFLEKRKPAWVAKVDMP